MLSPEMQIYTKQMEKWGLSWGQIFILGFTSRDLQPTQVGELILRGFHIKSRMGSGKSKYKYSEGKHSLGRPLEFYRLNLSDMSS